MIPRDDGERLKAAENRLSETMKGFKRAQQAAYWALFVWAVGSVLLYAVIVGLTEALVAK